MICSQNDIKFYKDFNLANFNTLKINSIAKMFFMPENTGELVTLAKKYPKSIILGMGSNILFSSRGVDDEIIYTGRVKNVSISQNAIEAEAGIKVQTLSKMALDRNLSGFEFLIGIPGSLGGALYMNAGAHNHAIEDTLISARVFDKTTGKTITLSKEDMKFSYRHSILQEKPYVVLSAKFELSKKEPQDIKSKMDEYIIFRKNRQPNLSLPNAGSTFKNPEMSEMSAGAIIDKTGLRGYCVGDCEVFQNHCNFIINKGSATSDDYLNIIYDIHTKVKEKFGYILRPEIIFIGNMSDEEKEKWQLMKQEKYQKK